MEGPPPLPRHPSFAEYRRVARKALDNRWIRHVERAQSIRVSYLVYRFLPGVRPNHVTLAGAAIGLCSLALLALRGDLWWVSVLGLQAWRILDGVDGELARTKRMASLVGEYLDSALDTLLWPTVFVGLALHYHEGAHHLSSLALAVVLALYLTRLAVLVRSHNLWKRGVRLEDVGGRPTDELASLQGQGGSLATRAGVRLMRLYAHYVQGYVTLNLASLALVADWAGRRWGAPVEPLGGTVLLAYYAPMLLILPAVFLGMVLRIRAMDRRAA